MAEGGTVEDGECSEELGISVEEKRKIVGEAMERGIEIQSYRDALRTGEAWRMRFIS